MINKLLKNGFMFLIGFFFIYACKHSPEEMAVPDNNNNNDPPLDTITCDSTNVTYAGVVYPILESSCISCHSGSAPSGGLDFTDYEDIAFVAQTGQLLGAIKHLSGFQPMPPSGPKLSTCEIALIEKWINDTTFNTGGGDIPCDPDTVYFQNDILPLLLSSCGTTGCHSEGSAQDDVILTSYFHVMQTTEVIPFDPDESEIYEKITEDDPDKRMPPPPASPLTNEQVNMIYTWISQGALNNFCDQEDCDTVNVTFSGSVLPLVQNNCLGCHSGANPGGGIMLTDYSGIRAAGQISPGNPGSLLGAITWTQGNLQMPQNGPQLSECEIAIVSKWIQNGMPNN